MSKFATEAKDLFEQKQKAFQQEEAGFKAEREKIAGRRKELASLNNYKVQQAAEKELDFATRQIQLKEEALLGTVDDLDLLESKAKNAQNASKELRKKVEAFLKEAQETMPSLTERLQRQTANRQEVLKSVNPAYLQQYERARTKHPTDAVVSVNTEGGCGGCHMSVGPQVLQKVMRGESVERCPGCARILYISADVELELQASS